QRVAAIEAQLHGTGAPCDARRRSRRQHVDPRRIANAGNERSMKLAILDDPCQGPLTKLMRRESKPAACVPANVHRFDRRETIRSQPLPRADVVEERDAARADSIDTR